MMSNDNIFSFTIHQSLVADIQSEGRVRGLKISRLANNRLPYNLSTSCTMHTYLLRSCLHTCTCTYRHKDQDKRKKKKNVCKVKIIKSKNQKKSKIATSDLESRSIQFCKMCITTDARQVIYKYTHTTNITQQPKDKSMYCKY